MLYDLFVSRDTKAKDCRELNNLINKYGEGTIEELRQRAKDQSLSPRDRRHWRRLLRFAKASAHDLV